MKSFRLCSIVLNSAMTMAITALIFTEAFELHSNGLVYLFILVVSLTVGTGVSYLITRSPRYGNLYLLITGVTSLCATIYLAGTLANSPEPLLAVVMLCGVMVNLAGWPKVNQPVHSHPASW